MTGVLAFLKIVVYTSGIAFAVFVLALCGIGLFRVGKRLQIWLRDDAENARHTHELMLASEARRKREAMAAGLALMPRNEQGMIGGLVIFKENGPTFIDGDRETVLMDEGKVAEMITANIQPIRQQVQEMRLMLAAYTSRGGGQSALPNIELPKLPLPEMYSVTDILAREKPDIDKIPLGLMATADGRLEDVRVPFRTMIHFIVIGTSGTGKSSMLRALALYLWRAGVQCVFIDMKGLSFQEWRNAGLLWPIATEPEQVMSVVHEIFLEQKRRQDIMAEAQVQDMWAYNKVHPDEVMQPMAVFVDEWTRLQEIDSAPFHAELDHVVGMGRSSGIAFCGGGTSINRESMPTTTKNNFATRACMAADAMASRILIGQDAASKIMHQGRALVRLPGGVARGLGVALAEAVEMQCLYVGEDAPIFQELDLGIAPAHDLVIEGQAIEVVRDARIKYTTDDFQRVYDELAELAVNGDPTPGDIAHRLTGRRGGSIIDRIKKWLKERE